MKFRVGDRVVVVLKEDGIHQPGTVVEDPDYGFVYVIDFDDKEYYWNEASRVAIEFLIPEELYDSPLYQALL